jgi:hypothetical protein
MVTLAALPLLGTGRADAARKQDVLVVPTRQRTVALAFDVRAMRDLVMITYRGTASTQNPLMHVWSPSANAWQELSAEAYAFGKFTTSQPGTIFLIGSDSDLPASVIEGASQASKVVRIDSISIAEMANIFNQHLAFSPREWKALAERHGLQTTDLNYERRKWGRFGPPPSERTGVQKAPVFPADELPKDIEQGIPTREATPVKINQKQTTPAAVAPPTPPAPITLDVSAAGASLEPEAAATPSVIATPPVTPVVIEEKGARTPPTALPTIGDLLPEDK